MIGLLKRLLTIIGIILLMVAVTLFLAAPQLIIDLATRLRDTTDALRALQVVIALLFDALMISILYRIIKPREEPGLIVRARGANTEVSLDSVQRQINTRIAQVSDVLDVQTDVLVEKGSAHVSMNVRTRPDIVIPEKQKEISRVLRQLIEKQMGLRLAGPATIHIALATDEFDTGDHVTTVVEPIPEEPLPSLPETATATYSEVTAEEIPAPQQAAPPSPQPPTPAETEAEPESPTIPVPEAAKSAPESKEPWHDFLLGDQE